MILEIVSGLLLGFFLVHVLNKIHQRLRLKRSNRIRERLEALARERRSATLPESQMKLNASILSQLISNWIIDVSTIGETQAILLKQLGLAKISGDVVIVNRELLSEIVNTIRQKRFEPEYRLVPLPSEILSKLGELGIISLSFIEISSQVGPRFLFATTRTELTDRISSDMELQNRLFILAGSQDELNIDGKRVILKEVKGGERGLKGIIVAEATRNADRSAIMSFLSKISTIPSSPEVTINEIRGAL